MIAWPAVLAAALAWSADPPPLAPRTVPGAADGRIEVFVEKDDAWSAPVLKALPEFAAVGRRTFGAKLPSVRFYLMSDESAYRALTKKELGEERVTGTGNFHIVTMCLPCEKRDPRETETTAVVLHEFGHAWMNTYLRERYGRDYLSPAVRRPFLDEGIADFIATAWDHKFLDRRRGWIRDLKVGKIPAPKLAELSVYSSFYDEGDRELHYWLSALLIEKMLGPKPAALRKIPAYLDLIGKGAPPEKAWEKATGKSLSAQYAALVRELWGNKTGGP